MIFYLYHFYCKAPLDLWEALCYISDTLLLLLCIVLQYIRELMNQITGLLQCI